MDSLDQNDIARICDALVRAVKKAASLVDAENYGDELRGLVVRAWEFHEMLRQAQLTTQDSWVVDELRTVCSEMGFTLKQIESLLAEARPPETTR